MVNIQQTPEDDRRMRREAQISAVAWRTHAARLQYRVQALEEALRNAISACSLCSGRGEYETDCPYCNDSAYVHYCVTEKRPCHRCDPWRRALTAEERRPA